MARALLAVMCAAAALSGCDRFRQASDTEVERAIDPVAVIEQVDLTDAVIQGANAEQAVAYFSRSTSEEPGRIDLRRGLAQSLDRAGQAEEAVAAWKQVVAHSGAGPEDRVNYAKALVRVGDWKGAEAELARVPPTFASAERYRLEAMIADSNQDWARADTMYDKAVGLSESPAGVLNNWGYSRLSRGDNAGAERLFGRALNDNPGLFTAKNNLVLARGARREYTLPIVEMTQIEKATLLHTAALSAVKQGDVATGQALLEDAIETHPQYFEAAARSLDALQNGGAATAVAALTPTDLPAAGTPAAADAAPVTPAAVEASATDPTAVTPAAVEASATDPSAVIVSVVN